MFHARYNIDLQDVLKFRFWKMIEQSFGAEKIPDGGEYVLSTRLVVLLKIFVRNTDSKTLEMISIS